MKKLIILVSLVFISNTFVAQEKIKPFSILDVGLEFQAYPTGYIPGIRIETNLNENSTIDFRLGKNIFDHKDFPKQAGINNHDSEIGSGYGVSIGYKRYLNQNFQKMFVGLRSDVWFNSVDWTVNISNCPTCNSEIKGHSDIVVIQPTVEVGYLFFIGKNERLFFVPEMALGYEWNAVVSGEQTGFGFILLGGINLGYRF